ncbi:MAG: NPCBM/NEW2 domain-containing protein [Pirellulales bacterium]
MAIQPLGGRTTYLSDLVPSGYKGIPWLTLAPEYRLDRNVAGGPLVVAKERAIKGLGMHGAARITYDLRPGDATFAARVGIDSSVGNVGRAVCRVYGDDGSGEWKALRETGVLRGGAEDEQVRLDIVGLKRLSLLVDFGPDDDAGDDVDWLDARLISK